MIALVRGARVVITSGIRAGQAGVIDSDVSEDPHTRFAVNLDVGMRWFVLAGEVCAEHLTAGERPPTAAELPQ